MRTQSKKVKSGAGLTLIELLTVIGMIGITMAIVAPSFSSVKKGIGLNNTAQEIVSTLRVAQNKAISSQRTGTADPTDIGVHFDANKYTLFFGAAYNSTATSNEVHTLSDSTVCTGAGTDVVFSRLSGMTSAAHTIELGLSGCGAKRAIAVSPSGTIQLQ